MNKNNVLEILDYMFEFIFTNNQLISGEEIDDIAIKNYLTEAGFDESNIDEALEYLIGQEQELPNIENITKQSSHSLRLFNSDEINKITKQGCALLLYLGVKKTLLSEVREILIEHVITNHKYYSFEEFLWLTQVAVLNQDNTDLRNVLMQIDFEENNNKH